AAAGVYKVQVVIDDCASEFSLDTPLVVMGDLPSNANAIGVYPNPIEAPTISKQDQVKAILTASPWKVNTVSVDGMDKTITYKDLGLTFTSTGFTSVSGAAIWPASGTWSFTSAEATAFKRDDGLEVTIQEATDTSLKLALTWNKTTLSSGKVESVSGAHVFSFKK
ncbi:MAG: hypothetical protein ACKO13_11725, partial [Cytophagales bacterium]